MKKIETSITELFVIEPDVYGDSRGFFFEHYNEDRFKEMGINTSFRQANHSRSLKGVLRGIHFQKDPKPMAKLVRCTFGKLWDVAVDLRPDSLTYKKWFGLELSEDNKKMLFIPEGFAHGFYSLTDCEINYMVSHVFDKDLDAGIAWNDPEIGVDWRLEGEPILSERDQNQPLLRDILYLSSNI